MDLVAHQYVEDLVSGHRVLDLDLRDGLPKSRNSYRLLDGETKQPHGLAEVWIVGRDWLYRANRLNGRTLKDLSLIHISEPTRLGMISYAVFCLKKKKTP